VETCKYLHALADHATMGVATNAIREDLHGMRRGHARGTCRTDHFGCMTGVGLHLRRHRRVSSSKSQAVRGTTSVSLENLAGGLDGVPVEPGPSNTGPLNVLRGRIKSRGGVPNSTRSTIAIGEVLRFRRRRCEAMGCGCHTLGGRG
jgi:hypothetical protein